MADRRADARPRSFYALAAVFGLFVLFLYGPMITIFVLSFQGPEGGLTFPMRGVSLHWFAKLWEGMGVVDIAAAFRRSVALGAVVMVCTVLLALGAGLAFRKKFAGSGAAVLHLGREPDHAVDRRLARHRPAVPADRHRRQGVVLEAVGLGSWLEGYGTSMGLYTSALGAHLTWTLPFGLLIMLAVFNRFNPAYEEAAADLGATPWQSFKHVVLPLIAPSLVGVGMFGFTLSWDEIARTSQAIGDVNTLPLELQGLTSTVHHAGDLRTRHGDHRGLVRGDGRYARADEVPQPAEDRCARRLTRRRRRRRRPPPTASTTPSTRPSSTTA